MTRRLSPHATERSTAASLPTSGALVGGKYRIERKLGSGGMGAVFEVTHHVTGRRFAIKWLLSHAAEGDAGIKRFVREAQIAGRIQHPNVVDVYDIHQEEDGIFLVMELLEGESLSSRLAREGGLAAHTACRIMLRCAEGVAAAHRAGVLHRDLTPANIFLCKAQAADPHPKVLDFGVSRLTRRDALDITDRRSGVVIGTPHYMAPERLRNEACDERVDVYSLGVTLYEMLSGKRPYEAVGYAELLLKIAQGYATPLAEHVPELPQGLAAVVACAMHAQPAARYPSIGAFIQALGPFATTSEAPAKSGFLRSSLLRRVAIGCGATLALGSAAYLYARDSVTQRAATSTRRADAAPNAVTAVEQRATPDLLARPAASPLPAAAPSTAPRPFKAPAETSKAPRRARPSRAPAMRAAPTDKTVEPADLVGKDSRSPAPRAPRLSLDGL